MHQMSPGVERAIAGARARAAREGAAAVKLTHLALALIEDDEGRPAVLLERAGLSVAGIRSKLEAVADPPDAPADEVLFGAARDWSIEHRYDPEFLTDGFLLAVLRADPGFERRAAAFGLVAAKLEAVLLGRTDPIPDAPAPPAPPPVTESVTPLAVLTGPDAGDEAAAARVVDVCFNRTREAARVLEDYCRFALSDRFLTEQVKEVRHALGAAAARLPRHVLLAARDTQADVGTSVTAAGEYDRTTPAQVAVANLKRLQESLRSLEEFGKLFGPELGRDVEALRYRAYTLERAVVSVGRNRERLAGSRLYALLTAAQCTASLDWTIAEAAAGGVDVVQLREKNLGDRELVARARDVRRWTEKAGVLFVVNDRPDVARLVAADGVHLGQDDMTVADARRVVGPDALIGVSTHTVEQVRRAVLDGADYLGVGPVFPSQTKAFDAFPGLDFVRAAAAETALPAFALGGIGPANLGQVVAAGATRVAVSSAIAAADEPGEVARVLRAGLEPSPL
ncbi:thiamine-phosphate pyrophosphorylase : Thiamine-phosphate synthase OS=Blastopirellula marina DSM 3645 GN=thiE PE=3 SV=1: Clp_N: TMP-TENI [Gemmataceae bacterium]|nr:thiamine-phosphate pyrophosphorylase : Thiamine-phosphate synthase OS=Blastopirellula marina DSM 3645 GN=thiE PE=3 SV=1: Clp_N: TMP-TENI [Gemmataceae bacterium]VTT97848.1 thiamine-phosphate pyrophosphorylase : Thiamine-phosphate synthase OS=Blastopirellula marina DSM 3645 GN=thiE PE=3 SV=1: Clp_N: TMP-TENI [Gemmataceae bacterium]